MTKPSPLSPAALRKRLRALPKVELHRHLEGSLRPGTLWEFHQATGAKRHASLEALREGASIAGDQRPGFAGFLSRFEALRFHYGGPEQIERLGREAVGDAAADGVAHLELRFSPVFLARRMKREAGSAARRGPQNALPPPPDEDVEAAAEALVRGARDEARRRGLSVIFILCLGRHFGVDVNRPASELLQRPIGAHFSALDVAGDEAAPLEPLAELIVPWRQAGKFLTFHAGEDPNGAGAQSVRRALEDFPGPPQRIGHGVRAVEDPAVVERLKARGVPLELCLTSNVQTRAAASFEEHPLRRLQEAGVTVTLNSDDPAISRTTLTEEYARAHERCGLSPRRLRALALAAAEAAFLPEAQRAALRARVASAWDTWLKETA